MVLLDLKKIATCLEEDLAISGNTTLAKEESDTRISGPMVRRTWRPDMLNKDPDYTYY